MKSVRLLPVVILAAAALLLFKSVGLMTQGGYVLTGVTSVQAAGGGSAKPAGVDAVADGGPTLDDGAPTLTDSAPTLPEPKAAASGHGGEAAPAEEGGAGHEAPAEGSGNSVADTAACPPLVNGQAPIPEGETKPMEVNCPQTEVAEPMIFDPVSGKVIPVAEAAGADRSEKQVLESLSQRRTELDNREAELNMRLALIEAAEKRVAERQAALEQLQNQVAALVDEKKSSEEEQFKALVSMYENMKPKEAALIFNELDPKVLLRVAKAMNPRKMAPIMAKMLPEKAQRLTVGLADNKTPAEPTATAADMDALPQIVGQ